MLLHFHVKATKAPEGATTGATAGGVVTLRGPVKSAEEKTKIEELATAAANGAKIDNQLEVKESH